LCGASRLVNHRSRLPTTAALPTTHRRRSNHSSNNSPNPKKYDLEVVPEQEHKACEIKLGSFRRQHMRAFHCAWFGLFVSKVAWYSASDVLPVITEGFDPTNSQVRTSFVVGLVSLALTRLVVGPLCDAHGPRVPFAVLLCLGSVPVALVGAVRSLGGLAAQRFFVGVIFGTLVPAEFWASRMFAKEIVGTANALVAGWGDLGAGTSCQRIGCYDLSQPARSF
jgi:MFS transporter, NNP family, nitrate/nitrite transporter